ncbi:DUF4974 domain-containing protein [Paludibacter sp. 221]|uniref:FecR family protein n=1 Tax=Paludibacter sp. 221 TaxID=2302939 RepID=UPI0013D619A9|nr:FecR family protein [Paludibacter sp. 221]NDV46979.1 DUF4974 domain-containing protein [Paludibacter sp. 221]
MKKPSDKIIDDVLNGLATEEDVAIVLQWFSTDEGQSYLSNHLDEYFGNIKEGHEDVYVPHTIPSEKIWDKIEKRTTLRSKHSVRSIALRVAAVLVPFLFIAAFFMFQKTDAPAMANYLDVSVPKGERSGIKLADGTNVYLNAGSTLSYPETFDDSSRKVILNGEAYFDVAKDKERPFIIELNGGAFIEVLGTAFNVQAYPEDDKISVALDNGKVRLTSSDNNKHELLPQETLVYKKEEKQTFITKNTDTMLASAWRDNIITFDDTPLEEVIKVLNRWYDVEFKVEDKEALNYSYTITTKKIPQKKLLSDFEKIAPVKFVQEQDTVKIRMK